MTANPQSGQSNKMQVIQITHNLTMINSSSIRAIERAMPRIKKRARKEIIE